MAAGALASEVVIYALCDPVSGETRYIGKTINLSSRIRHHRWESGGTTIRTHKANWIRGLLPCEPSVKILEICTAETWAEGERRWIANARARGVRLTNFADGGETSPVEGKGHSEETKQKMRELALQRGDRPPSRCGQRASDETRLKLRHAALLRGCRPPSRGGWNKGTHRTHCPSGHAYSEYGRLAFRADRNQTYQICGICERKNQSAYHLRRVA